MTVHPCPCRSHRQRIVSRNEGNGLFLSSRQRHFKSQRFVTILTVSIVFLASYSSALPRFDTHQHPFTVNSRTYRSALQIRGGSTKKPSAKRRAKATNSRRSIVKNKPTREITNDKVEQTSAISSVDVLPFAETLLVPRNLRWTRFIQSTSSLALILSFVGCVKTAGRPNAAAVSSIVHGTLSTQREQSTTSVPSLLDEVLARRLADAAGEVLPPSHLPNPAPLVGVLLSLALYIAATLFPKWFLQFDIRMNYTTIPKSEIQDRLQQGGEVFVNVQVPREERHLDGKSHVLCRLHTTDTPYSNDLIFYFDLHHKRYYYNPNAKQQQHQVVDGGPTLHSSTPLQQLVTAPGLTKTSSLSQAQQQFGSYNTLSLPSPTIMAAFVTRISSPLSVMQLLGKLLSALEEDLKSSCMSLATTLAHHYWNAKRSIMSATELSKEVGGSVQDASKETVWASRPSSKKKKRAVWKRLQAVELLPGDVFVLNNTASVVPVDALLLEGACVTNEAVLTGESVPQTKIPLNVDNDGTTCLDIHGSHRHSVLFAGTSLLHCTNSQGSANSATEAKPKVPAGCTGARFLALRTGSYSSRGELLRALLARNSNHVGAISNPQTERDALRLIASLSCFAAVACASLFYGRNEIKTSAFRRIVQCTRIAVASIPSDLPLALSSVAQYCSQRLRQEADVVCSEPASLLTAAHVEIVVFDKTGTLTADTQKLSRVVSPKKSTDTGIDEVILAGCHSLVDLKVPSTNERRFAGDPLDLASLQYAGWTYDRKYGAYQRKHPKQKEGPVKLWQIKTFPFDATRRTSSALLLVLHADGECRLYKTIKGSPEVIGNIIGPKHNKWYKAQIRKLGGQGLRTIALAAQEISDYDTITTSLFHGGLPNPSNVSNEEFREVVAQAQHEASTLHRSDFEGFEIDGTTTDQSSFDLVGFACFDASIRPSTRRIIEELKAAQVNVIMLTGDGIDAAIAVGEKAGLLDFDSVAVFELDESSNLVWRTMTRKIVSKNKKKRKRSSSFEVDEFVDVTLETITSAFERAAAGRCGLAITGSAAAQLLSSRSQLDDKTRSKLIANLYQFTVFARASPKQKRMIVSNLKDHSGMKVLMCGDGVNDVAAMKVADVGAALLNGFGDEGMTSSTDIEDERRLHQLSQRKIGSNRRKHIAFASDTDPLSVAGIGSSATASSARIKAEIDNALLEIKQRAKMRQQDGEYSIQYMFQDMKDSFSAVFRVLKEERNRKKTLQKGGGGAARILAQEDKLRRELTKRAAQADEETLTNSQQSSSSAMIKPGEASLAAAFSCLRPAIDGVEGLMRVGIAAAACASSVQQTIALNCLLSCYNLATLYRDGFRYGKYLWNVELLFGMGIDQAIYHSSTTARPRLSIARPEKSLFHPNAAMSVCALAFIHLMTLTIGVRTGNALEEIYALPNNHGSKVRWKDNSTRPSTFASLSKALAAAPRPPKSEETKRRGLGLLGRPPFRPNYATNIVFFLSIAQNAVSALVTHTGKPFYGTILESRQLCLWIGASFLFVVAGITEAFPRVNEILELRSLPSRRHQRSLLALLVIDLVGCLAAKWIIDGFPVHRDEGKLVVTGEQSAADKEEALLVEEANENKRLLVAFGVGLLLMVASTFR